jgi:hypothetical protein
MGDYLLDGNNLSKTKSFSDSYDSWTTEQFADYIAGQGLVEYKPCIIAHKITGKLAPLLSELDLKEMGIKCIGERLRFRLIVENLKRKSRILNRTRCIWQGEERVFYSETSAFVFTLCGCCPIDPSIYKLQGSHLKIKTVKPFRIGRIRCCCCGSEYTNSNVDLTYVADVDVIGVPASCCERILCCAPGKDIVDIEIRGYGGGDVTNHKLILRESEGDRVASLIINGIEDSQKIDRD